MIEAFGARSRRSGSKRRTCRRTGGKSKRANRSRSRSPSNRRRPAATAASITLQTTAGTASVQLTGTAAPPGRAADHPRSRLVRRRRRRTRSDPLVHGLEHRRRRHHDLQVQAAGRRRRSRPRARSPRTRRSPPGETLVETVRFAPTALGPASATWLINGEGSSSVHEVRFSGTGETLSGDPCTPARRRRHPALQGGRAGRAAGRLRCSARRRPAR